jgi:hypothetical protein
MFLYIGCLARAASCCEYCAKTEGAASKDSWRMAMMDYCGEAEINLNDLCATGDADYDELQRLHLFLLSVCEVCPKCDGREALILPMIRKEWINPHVQEIEQATYFIEEKLKKNDALVTTCKVVSFDFEKKKRL